jgi:hypothetical protein
MLDLLPKDCLENILQYLLNDIYIKNWDDVNPFTRHEWSELKDPLHFSKSFHYNCNRVEVFNIQTILKIAKGYTKEETLLPTGVTNYARNYIKNRDEKLLDWKTKKKIQIPEADYILLQKWRPSPYYISLMFMNVCKNTRGNIDTDDYWNRRFSNDYRKGLLYIRVPRDIRNKYKEKVKETILSRYEYLLENINVECKRYSEKIIAEIENRNILLDLIKNQINTSSDDIPIIDLIPYKTTILIPPIYLSNIEMNAVNPYHLNLQNVVLKIERHQNTIDSFSLNYKKFMVIKKKIDNLFRKHDLNIN